jgi:hypothetical protein
MTKAFTITYPDRFKFKPISIPIPRDQHGRYFRVPQYGHKAEHDGLEGTWLRLYAGPMVNHYCGPPPSCEATAAPEAIGDIE